jgi:predicted DCC family thiol-disulfide oxidoreductase YuxK
MTDPKNIKHPIILFDGVCNLCAGSVQFIIKRDNNKYFRFASLQSDFAKIILQPSQLSENNFSSIILWEDGKIYTQSAAALRITKHLSGGWKLLFALIIIPAFIRNYMYSIIARHRYRWFGKKEKCWIPNDEWKDLFIE